MLLWFSISSIDLHLQDKEISLKEKKSQANKMRATLPPKKEKLLRAKTQRVYLSNSSINKETDLPRRVSTSLKHKLREVHKSTKAQ